MPATLQLLPLMVPNARFIVSSSKVSGPVGLARRSLEGVRSAGRVSDSSPLLRASAAQPAPLKSLVWATY